MESPNIGKAFLLSLIVLFPTVQQLVSCPLLVSLGEETKYASQSEAETPNFHLEAYILWPDHKFSPFLMDNIA